MFDLIWFISHPNISICCVITQALEAQRRLEEQKARQQLEEQKRIEAEKLEQQRQHEEAWRQYYAQQQVPSIGLVTGY